MYLYKICFVTNDTTQHYTPLKVETLFIHYNDLNIEWIRNSAIVHRES